MWDHALSHKKRQNKSFCCSGPLQTHTCSLSLIIKWALVPQCYGSGLWTRGYTSLTPLCTHASGNTRCCWFSLYINIYWGEIVEVQKTTRSTSEYKAILCLVVLRFGHIKHCWANFHRQNPAISQDQEFCVRAKKNILMQIWLLYALYGTMFYFCYPAWFENSKSILYFSGNWKFDHLMHLCTYIYIIFQIF